MSVNNKNNLFNLIEDPDNHYTFFPIRNQWYYDHYKKQVATFWTVEEVDLANDREHFEKKLTHNEREFIKQVLAFFAASDGIVAENLDLNFTEEITYKEVAQCLRFQAMMEDIHGEMYSLMIDNLIPDKEERERLLNAINTIPCVALKAKWAQKWANKDKSISERLVAWACVEGIQFSGSFCAIAWLGKRGLMPGLQVANQFIRRDEGNHTITSVKLYNDLKEKERLSEDKVMKIVSEALDIEKEFITESIPCSMLGMNSNLMKQYLEYVSDMLLLQLGYDKKWNTNNPFDFMENLSVENKTNFFEERVTEYNKSGVGTSEEERILTFNDDDDDF
jgi:ribonucleotide reductase beta subunit family protein with ferritin-like domain